MTPEWVTAVAAVATAVITLGAALVALGQLRAAREEQRQVNRPMMIAEYEIPAGAGAPRGISVQNIGRTIAHDVRISFEPPLPDPPAGADRRAHPRGDHGDRAGAHHLRHLGTGAAAAGAAAAPAAGGRRPRGIGRGRPGPPADPHPLPRP